MLSKLCCSITNLVSLDAQTHLKVDGLAELMLLPNNDKLIAIPGGLALMLYVLPSQAPGINPNYDKPIKIREKAFKSSKNDA